jgi:hypothetical protein
VRKEDGGRRQKERERGAASRAPVGTLGTWINDYEAHMRTGNGSQTQLELIKQGLQAASHTAEYSDCQMIMY